MRRVLVVVALAILLAVGAFGTAAGNAAAGRGWCHPISACG
jgi:hypothetical protein